MLPGSKVICIQKIHAHESLIRYGVKTPEEGYEDVVKNIKMLAPPDAVCKGLYISLENFKNPLNPKGVEYMFDITAFREILPPQDSQLFVDETIANEELIDTVYYSKELQPA
ncbi:MAG TPA: hypothetical protein PLS56_01335 [Candidatus Dojkabacteria bacterium]|nr:hypothetical protein [Candidatus Dojkabacteria bacterium]